MEKNYYATVDLGASNGRVILYWIENGLLHAENIYRFENRLVKKDNQVCWDLDKLFNEILIGLKMCGEDHKIPKSIAIDSWGVDFVILNKDMRIIGNSVSYRDNRTNKVFEEAFNIMSKEDLYKKTGIQMMQINTLYQLLAMMKSENLEEAEHFLMIPDYFNYLLTGILSNEYTNASTTQLINMRTRVWDEDFLNKYKIPLKVFHDIRFPKERIGKLQQDIVDKIGYACNVVLCASHDTGSAFLSSVVENAVILSSGTWSILGVCLKEGINTSKSYLANYSNEGGYDKSIRYLKNVMGLWIIQEIKRALKNDVSYGQLSEMANNEMYSDTYIKINNQRFLNPNNMIEEIESYCEEHGIVKPRDIGEIIHWVCYSMAIEYKKVIEELEKTTGKEYSYINVIGGGSQNQHLNKEIEIVCNKKVITGPVEATSIGNAMVQMIAEGEIADIEKGREIIANSMREKTIR